MIRIGMGRAVVALLTTKVMLATLGFGRALRLLERGAVIRRPVDAERAVIEAAARTVVTAAVLIPGRIECLEQSVALWYLLRRSGVAVDLQFGVRQLPFSAHAWVTYRGEPVNEDAEALRQYAVFA